MEKYYGFHVNIDSELDPFHIDVLKERAEKIISAYDFNPEEYFLYFHQLSIIPKKSHFNFEGSLSKRLKNAELTFSVNLKQKKLRHIKFFNFLLDNGENEKQVKYTGGTYEVKYFLKGLYLEKNLGFRNEIVTFINKKILPRHRKIKISFVAYPTKKYMKVFKNQPDSHLTQLDLKFEKPISLKAPSNTLVNNEMQKTKSEKKEGKVTVMSNGDTYIINGQAAAVGKNSKAENTTNQQIISNNSDLEELKKELEQLRLAMRDEAKVTDDDLAIVEIGKAIEASENSNTTKVLEHLKKAGNKALEISEKIGVTIASAAIKQGLDL